MLADATAEGTAQADALPFGVARKAPGERPQRATILVSYYYLRKIPQLLEFMVAIAPYVDVMVDSGGFSAYAASKKLAAKGLPPEVLTVPEYCDWLLDYGPLWWQYVALDEIRNVEVSRRNLDTMVARGTKPMPVFVYPESYERVPELLTVNDHICCAGLVDSARDFAEQRVQRVFDASGGKARIHGLGFVRYPAFMQLPLNSVDSSSFTSAARYGTLARCDARLRLSSVTWREYAEARQPEWVAYLRDECGAPPRVANSADRFRGMGLGHLATTFAHLTLSHRVAQRGRRYFLAMATTQFVRSVVAVLATMRAAPGSVPSFDYVESARILKELTLMGRKQGKEAAKLAGTLLSETTRWQERLP